MAVQGAAGEEEPAATAKSFADAAAEFAAEVEEDEPAAATKSAAAAAADGAAPDVLPPFLSTIGPDHRNGNDQPAVVLLRTTDPNVQMLPQEIGLDPGSQESVTLGRHSLNEAVLSIKACSKVHCQFALRSFRLPTGTSAHQALFLRDVSKNRTLVNGKLAFKPWHWLHDGDRVGLHASKSDLKNIMEFFEVSYRSHVKLPGDAGKKPAEATASVVAQGSKKRGLPVLKPGDTLDATVVGRIIDIHYHEEDPPATFRVKIVSFNKKKLWHGVDSKGYSMWDGESFTDEVDLSEMFLEGHVKFVDGDEADTDAKPSKRKRC